MLEESSGYPSAIVDYCQIVKIRNPLSSVLMKHCSLGNQLTPKYTISSWSLWRVTTTLAEEPQSLGGSRGKCWPFMLLTTSHRTSHALENLPLRKLSCQGNVRRDSAYYNVPRFDSAGSHQDSIRRFETRQQTYKHETISMR